MGRSRLIEAWSISITPISGAGQALGQSDRAMARRTSWPGSKCQVVASRSMVRSNHSPKGTSVGFDRGLPVGQVQEAAGDQRRRAAGQAVGQLERRGWRPGGRSGPAGGAGDGRGRRCPPRARASAAGVSGPRRLAGRWAGPTAATPHRSSTPPRRRRGPRARAAPPRRRPGTTPWRARAVATTAGPTTRRGARPGRARARPRPARRPGSAGRCRPRCRRPAGGVRTRRSARVRDRCAGPGSEDAVDMWLHGPASRRLGQVRRSKVRKVLLR